MNVLEFLFWDFQISWMVARGDDEWFGYFWTLKFLNFMVDVDGEDDEEEGKKIKLFLGIWSWWVFYLNKIVYKLFLSWCYMVECIK